MQDQTLSLRLSKSERRALRAYGVTPEAEPLKSGYDVIKHVIGTHHGGPTDLSSNPEHLDDYGQ